MKKLLSFLSYHNAVPAVLIVLAIGAGSAFAASTGVLPLPSTAPTPAHLDASALLNADLSTFAFDPTVTAVTETDTAYTVDYLLQTLAPEGDAWAATSKTGEFSVPKAALGAGGLNAYVVQKLTDIENGELAYLQKAQDDERALAQQPAPASAFSGLVGLSLGEIPVPVVAKPIPPAMSEPQNPPPQAAPVLQSNDTPSETSMQSATSSTSDTATPSATSTSATTTSPIVGTDASSTASTTPAENAQPAVPASATSTPPAPAPDASSTPATSAVPDASEPPSTATPAQ